MKKLAENMLVVLPKLSPYGTRSENLGEAYVNLVRFFRNRFGIETHVISSAGSALAVTMPENVRAVQAVHPADVEFFNYHIMPLAKQDIQYNDAFDAAAAEVPLIRGLSVDKRLAAVAGREAAAVKHIARKYYNLVVDFEHPRNSIYHLSPKTTKIYLRVSTVNLTVEAFFNSKLFDLGTLVEYGGTHKPLGAWDEGGQLYAVS